MCGLYSDRYRDFTVKHFHEKLVREHDYKPCYTVTRLALQSAGLVQGDAAGQEPQEARAAAAAWHAAVSGWFDALLAARYRRPAGPDRDVG